MHVRVRVYMCVCVRVWCVCGVCVCGVCVWCVSGVCVVCVCGHVNGFAEREKLREKEMEYFILASESEQLVKGYSLCAFVCLYVRGSGG